MPNERKRDSLQSPAVVRPTRKKSPNHDIVVFTNAKSGSSKTPTTSSQNTKTTQAAASCSQPPSLSVNHRPLTECPCGRSSDNKSWKMDCSKCGQYWHVDCLSLNGLDETSINKLLSFLCPFCFVSPVPTITTSEDVCYVCRNTLSLQQTNIEMESSIAASKIEPLAKCCKLLNEIDFAEFSNRIDTLSQFDQRLQHLLLSDHSLKSLDTEMKHLSGLLTTSSEQSSTPTLDHTIENLTTALNTHNETSNSLTNQLNQLKEQVTSLSSNIRTSPTSDQSDQLLERVSRELGEVCKQEVQQSIVNLQSSSGKLPSLPRSQEVDIQVVPTLPPHSHPPVSHATPDFIDEETETDLINLLESCSSDFKQENGRSVLAFGAKYHYTGTKSSTSLKPLPSQLQTLITRLNTAHPDTPHVNSILINRYEGSSSFLPQHADNEPTIHPHSSIHTLSLGNQCTVTFCKTGTTDPHHNESCLPRSLYTMSRASQDLYEHRIDPGSIGSGIRYSVTLRPVSPLNRASTCIIGDSNTGGLKFGLDPKSSFGKFLPGKQYFAPTIEQIDPYISCGHRHTVILCGLNDIRQENVKSPSDIKRIFNKYAEKIAEIQAVNKKTHVYICQLLPTKCMDLNKRVNFFNYLIHTQLLPVNFGVTLVQEFNGFADENGLLSQHLSRRLTKFMKPDYLHLNWKGVAKLAAILKNTILLRVNGGQDRRKTRVAGRQVDSTSYSDMAARSPVGRRELSAPDGYQPS